MRYRRRPVEVEAHDKGNGWWEVKDPVHGWIKVIKPILERDYEPISEPSQPAPWMCKARTAGTAGGNLPQDCDWPFCGCDEKASEVLAALQEMNLELTYRLTRREPPLVAAQRARPEDVGVRGESVSKHTPFPWVVNRGKYAHITNPLYKGIVAILRCPGGNEPPLMIVNPNDHRVTPEECEANARLIARAVKALAGKSSEISNGSK